jgi:hypothetical protein
MYTKTPFYNMLLEMVKVVNLKQDNQLCIYFVVPFSANSLAEFADEIGGKFDLLIPKVFTLKVLPLLELNGFTEIEYKESKFTFEFVTGSKFNEKYVSDK